MAGGPYAITASNALGTGLGNYSISYAPSTLTVTPRPITITADAKSRVYGDANPQLTYRIGGSGLVNNDTLSGSLGTNATTASTVGAYGITQGSLAASGNYTVVNYDGANLTVTPRPLAVVVDAQSRVYGDANPTLTYRIYTVNGSGSFTSGLVNGDTLTGGLTTNATTASNVGGYGITQGSLTSASNRNYAVSYVGANLTVAARPITVFATAQSRPILSSNPALTYTIGGRGLVNGDQLSGNLATNANLFSLPGSYAITRGSLNASPNYALTCVGANLNVTLFAPSPWPCFLLSPFGFSSLFGRPGFFY